MAEFAALIPTVGMIRALRLEIAPAEPWGLDCSQHLDRMLLLGRLVPLLHGIGSPPALRCRAVRHSNIALGMLLHSKLSSDRDGIGQDRIVSLLTGLLRGRGTGR